MERIETSLVNVNNRNYGIDAARVLAMFVIVLSHLLAHGGVYDVAKEIGGGINGAVIFLKVLCYWPVNVYAIASGYAGFRSVHRPSRIIYLYFEVLFYSISISLVFYVLGMCSFNNVLSGFFPLLFEKYWYFTAYLCLFLLMKVLDRIVDMFDGVKLGLILSVLCIINSFSVTGNAFKLNYGMSASWLCIMYVVGCLIRKYRIERAVKTKSCLIAMVLSITISYIGCICIPYMPNMITSLGIGENQFLKFTSPFVVVTAISIVLLTAKLDIKKKQVAKVIGFAYPLTFGVYCIHENGILVDNVYRNRLSNMLGHGFAWFLLMVMVLAVGFFCICLLIDYLRKKLFFVLKIEHASKIIGDYITEKYRHFCMMIISKEKEIGK